MMHVLFWSAFLVWLVGIGMMSGGAWCWLKVILTGDKTENRIRYMCVTFAGAIQLLTARAVIIDAAGKLS